MNYGIVLTMTAKDNVIKSEDVAEKKPAVAKKAAAKKATVKTSTKTEEEIKETPVDNSGDIYIVFETGIAYISGDIHFTRNNRIQKINYTDAQRLLELDNFRLADQLEIEDFIASGDGA